MLRVPGLQRSKLRVPLGNKITDCRRDSCDSVNTNGVFLEKEKGFIKWPPIDTKLLTLNQPSEDARLDQCLVKKY